MLLDSLLDNDLYKFTMMQFAFHHYPKQEAEYRLLSRNPKVKLDPKVLPRLPEEIQAISQLSFSSSELTYLKSLSLFSPKFLSYLANFSLKKHHVSLSATSPLAITIKGPWPEVILWEVILLALISELHFSSNLARSLKTSEERLKKKVEMIKGRAPCLSFMEFGTRRRLSFLWQHFLNGYLKEHLPFSFLGTSNIKLAMDLDLPCLGTMGHEFLQVGQSVAPLFTNFQAYMLKRWLKEYPQKHSIAVTDVLSLTAFLQDFSWDLAHQFKGVRIDSGDPIVAGEKVVDFYQKKGLNPLEKKLVFSDGIHFSRALKIASQFHGKIPVQFGIGTYFTNDHCASPLNLVIKLVAFDQKPVAKLTDTPQKAFGFAPISLEKLKRLDAQKKSGIL